MYLAVIPAIKCHTVIPEVFEKMGQNLLFYVLSFDTIGCTALFDNLVIK